MVKSFQWVGRHESPRKQPPPTGGGPLGHGPPGRAVAQAGAVALVRDPERGGHRQAGGCHGGGGRHLVGATVLEEELHALLAASAAGQRQRRQPLGIPVADVKAVLRREKW